MSKKNEKIDLTGTYEEAMDEIDNASITDEFKDHLREEYHKVYDEVGQMISMESPTEIPSWVKLTQQSKFNLSGEHSPLLIVMQEIPMTTSEMMAAYVKAAKKKVVEDYVEEVLEDMSEEDLYCNFRLNGDMFDFRETDKTDIYEDKYRDEYSINNQGGTGWGK